jgi:hypothetical protein
MPPVGDFKACTECVFITKKCSFENQNYTSRYQARIFLEGLPPSRALLRFSRHNEDIKERTKK